jgi:hypothetical protein
MSWGIAAHLLDVPRSVRDCRDPLNHTPRLNAEQYEVDSDPSCFMLFVSFVVAFLLGSRCLCGFQVSELAARKNWRVVPYSIVGFIEA